MRKLLSLLLVVLMVFSLSMPAYAITSDDSDGQLNETEIGDADNTGENTGETTDGVVTTPPADGSEEGDATGDEGTIPPADSSEEGDATGDEGTIPPADSSEEGDATGDEGTNPPADSSEEGDATGDEGTNPPADSSEEGDATGDEGTNPPTDGSEEGDATGDEGTNPPADGSEEGDATESDVLPQTLAAPIEKVESAEEEIIDEPPTIEGIPPEFFDIDFDEPEIKDNSDIESARWHWPHKPEAINVEISGDPHVGINLKAVYEFYDEDGDREDSVGSLIVWFIDGHLLKYGYSNTPGITELKVTEDMVGKRIQFLVTPISSRWPHWGLPVLSNEIEILPPDFMITVDDGYDLYINGIEEGSDPSDWANIDYYYFDNGMPNPAVVAVKGFDTDGSKNIAGFTAATYQNNQVITDVSWYKHVGDKPSSDDSNDKIWTEPGYKGIPGEWTLATVIPENDIDEFWPTRIQELSDAEWIWSNLYMVEQENPFHSPVYFRNVLEFLSPPYVDNVKINDTEEETVEVLGAVTPQYRLGQTLYGSYDYHDPDGDPEGISTYQWYLDGNPIPGATGMSFTLEYNENLTYNVLEGEITFEVTPVSQYAPTTGDPVASDPVTVEEPDLWITVDDGYSLYVNGVEVGSEDPSLEGWKIPDYYYFDSNVIPIPEPYDADEILIAVKGMDKDGGTATISGFTLAYKDPEGDWLVTDDNWQTLYIDDLDPPAYVYGEDSYEWYHEGYRSNDWISANIIADPHTSWPTSHSYLSRASWIWTDDYKGTEFDSPVYFRTILETLPEYDEEANVLSVSKEILWLDESTEARVQLFDIDDNPLNPIDPGNDYTVEFFLDGTSVGTGGFDSSNIWYDLAITPGAPGEYILSAEVNGVPVANTITIIVNKDSLIPKGDLSVDHDLVYEGDEVIATLVLVDQDENPATGQSVTIYDDGVAMAATESAPGIYTVTFVPEVGMNIITASVEGYPSPDINSTEVEVINVIRTLEHGRSVTGDTALENTYDALALLAQLTTFVPEIGMLRSDIIEHSMETTISGMPELNYKDDYFYSYVENSYRMPGSRRMEEPEYPLNYLASETGVIKDQSGRIIGVVGHEIIPLSGPRASENIGYHEVEYHEQIENPVVLAHLGSDFIVEDIHARVVDVNPAYEERANTISTAATHATSFGVILEPNIISGARASSESEAFEVISYLVIEEGVHQLDGVIVEATKLTDFYSSATHEFSDHYYMPSVFSQTQTYKNMRPRWMRENNITSNTVDLMLQRAPEYYDDLVYDTSERLIQEYPEEVAVVLLANNLLHEVTFTNTGSSSFDPQMVEHGTTATDPGTPSRSGYSFTGWTLDGSSFDLTTDVVTDDIELVATWRSRGGGDDDPNPTIKAVDDTLETDENTPVTVSTTQLMANDTDANDFESVQNPINGSVSLSGGTVTFTPDPGFTDTGYFSYTISDGGDEDNGLVTVTVNKLVEINEFEPPLGGDPDALILINDEEPPLGAIDYSLPYILGYPDQSFKPNREITRGEMAAIFARILFMNTSNPGEPLYTDVMPDDWYYKYVQTVTQAGILSGYEGNEFKPNRPISHAEIASAFSKYWEIKGIEISDAGGHYPDIDGHWAEADINRFFNAGISVGFMDGTFKPNSFTTRAELVVMVNRTLNRPELVDIAPTFPDVQPSFWGYGAIEAASKRHQGESAFKE